ncbi:helix-turn-helix domain-containing protein [Kitasatospora sp. NPDC101447]|uniref:AraC-like ligand-binding domain-containing protein n=1 Tax=Kitasatospora sp. NPDC101447 TaxID=3364102 RepID=UPI00381202FE
MSVTLVTLPPHTSPATPPATPPRDRAGHWHALVSGTFVPLDLIAHEDVCPVGTITSRRLGPLRISEVEAGPQTASRSRRRISQGGAEFLTVTLQQRGTARLTQDGRQALVGPGAFTCSDAGRPYRREHPEHFRFTAFRLPKAALGVTDDELRAVTGTVFNGSSGTSGLIAGYLNRLAAQAADFDPGTGHRLALTTADLLAVLVRERQGRAVRQHPEAARGMLARIEDYILRHLGEPDLSPARIAEAHHISVRYLHKLFRAEGTTVGRWVQRERLDRCRRELSRPARTMPAISAVAHRWGFVSPSHFSRSFRTTYGMSPREWQATTRLRPAAPGAAAPSGAGA